jgi:hypothetical protein
VVHGGVRGAGINFAIPVGRLTEVLASPVVLLETAGLSYKTRQAPADWIVRLIPTRLAADSTVEVVVESEAGPPRTFPAKPSGKGDGVFVAKVTPVVGGSTNGSAMLGLTASFGAGQIEGKVADRAVKFGDKEFRIAGLRAIRIAPRPAAVLGDGTEVFGLPTGLDAVPIELGGAIVTVDLSRATRIEFQAPASGSLTLRCTPKVRRGKVEVASVERAFELQEGVASSESLGGLVGGPSAIRPPDLSSDRVEIKLPGTVTDITAGAGGRLLLLTLKDVKKLAVFDVNAGKVIRLLSLPSDDALVAAGSGKFVIVSPGQSVVHRWDLATLERERTAPLPFNGRISAIAMGSRSTGPVMAFVTTDGNNGYNSAVFAFFDAETLRPMKGFHQSNHFMNSRQNANPALEQAGLISTPHFSTNNERVQLRASPGGDLFAAWSTMHSPAGLLSFVWKDKKTVEFHYDHTDTGFTAPGPDGRTMYTGTGGLFNDQLKPIGGDLSKSRAYIPSNVANYFVGIEGKRVSLFVAGTGTPLVDLGELDELNPTGGPQTYRQNQGNAKDLIADKRVQFISQANLLVTIPTGKDILVLRRVNPIELLKKSELDYLFVESIPITEAFKGKVYDYVVKVQSRKGRVKYEVSGGPDGMKISPEGRLTWDIPRDFEGDEVTPIILVKDSSGQEIFHTFNIHLR